MTEETTQAPETDEAPAVIDYSSQLDGIHSEVSQVNGYLYEIGNSLNQLNYNTQLSNTIGLFNIALLVGVGVTLLLSRVFKRFF